jgi:hypothetical protein
LWRNGVFGLSEGASRRTELNHFVRFQRNGGDDACPNVSAAPTLLAAPEFKADPKVGVFHVDVDD